MIRAEEVTSNSLFLEMDESYGTISQYTSFPSKAYIIHRRNEFRASKTMQSTLELCGSGGLSEEQAFGRT